MNTTDKQAARIAELEAAIAQSLPLIAAGSERIAELEKALQAIIALTGGPQRAAGWLVNGIARDALKPKVPA